MSTASGSDSVDGDTVQEMPRFTDTICLQQLEIPMGWAELTFRTHPALGVCGSKQDEESVRDGPGSSFGTYYVTPVDAR